MTYTQRALFTRQDLLAEQAASAAILDRHLDAVHSWCYASVDNAGRTLEDHILEIREAATTIRVIDLLLRQAE